MCYAYLSDVKEQTPNHSMDTSNSDPGSFQASLWFTRGWTLQELLAPRNMVFFNYAWNDIGTRSTLYLSIREVTGIQDLSGWETASVAQKMSWAARRDTTRVEDEAYCLMGLFGINMPLLYGEGNNAFLRLQIEILGQSDDESLFAWEDFLSKDSTWDNTWGLLAPSPFSFRNSGDILPRIFVSRPPYSMTNQGLRIDIISCSDSDSEYFQTPINCMKKGSGPIGLCLAGENDRLQRVRTCELGTLASRDAKLPELTTVYIKQIALNPTTNETPTELPEGRTLYPGWDRAFIQTKELESYGFAYDEYQVCLNQMPTWDKGGDRGQGISGQIDFRFKQNGSYGLVFKRGNERFMLLLHSREKHLSAKILTLLKNQSLEELETKLHLQECPDRVSQLLTSGMSVSATIKKGYFDRPCYFIDIKIHEDGRLEWPRKRIDYEFRIVDKPLPSERPPNELPSEIPTGGQIGLPSGLPSEIENEFGQALILDQGEVEEKEEEHKGEEEEEEEEELGEEGALWSLLGKSGVREDGTLVPDLTGPWQKHR